MRPQSFRYLATGAALAALIAAPVQAQDRKGRDRLLQPFTDCGEVTGSAERLACFDAALASLAERRAAVEQREEEETIASFGLRPEDVSNTDEEIARQSVDATFTADDKGDATLEATVADVYTSSAGRKALLLTNGQLWREASNSSLRMRPKPGWKAKITKGPFGSYRMRFDGKPGFLSVLRVR